MIKKYSEYIKNNPEGYWFKRKIFGWGWVPATREGWLVMLGFMLLLFGNVFRVSGLDISEEEAGFQILAPAIVLIVILLVICIKKGEPPKWQWGIPDEDDK